MSLLKNSQFLRLWGNQILLLTAFNLTSFTALLLIDQLTHSRFSLAMFYATTTIPSFIVGLFAGAVVDTVDRKRLMLLADFLLIGLFLSYAFYTHNYWAIFLVSFVTAVVAQFFSPAEAATIPYIVKKDELETANTFYLFTSLATVLGGYALSGPIIQSFGGLNHYGDQAVFLFSSILTLFGFLILLSLKNINTQKAVTADNEIFSQTTSLTREVLAEARRNLKIALPVIFLTLLQFNFGLLFILSIEYVRNYLLLPTTSASLILIIPLIFGLPGGFFLMRKMHDKWGRGKTVFMGVLLLGLAITLLGVTGEVFFGQSHLLRFVTIICAGLVGASSILIAVPARTSLQENTPKFMLGRVFALVAVTGSAVTPLPLLLLAFITESLASAWVFLAVGLATIFIALFTKKSLTKNL